MSKELEALEKINEIILPYSEAKQDYLRPRDVCQNEFEIIENALKNYEELTSKPVILCRRTHGEAQKLIDMICKNYKDVKITNLEDEKKIKVLDIIKSADLSLEFDESQNEWFLHINAKGTGIKTYDLLKEVLS